MNVLLVNTSDRMGGAAIAAIRLMDALNANGIKAKMLVRIKHTDSLTVSALPQTFKLKWNFVWERALVWIHNRFRKKNLWQMDIASMGTDITQLEEFKWADVIHIHWVNQGFLSMSNLEKIVMSGKRIVWTLHDQWPYTGICHYTDGCERFQEHCHHCHLLDERKEKDLSYRLFDKKMKLYRLVNRITFVGCSQWIADLAKKSALLKGCEPDRVNGTIPPCKVVHIPNTIDQNVFCPTDKLKARDAHGLPHDKMLLLFSSMKVTDKRKGIDYLVEACRLLQQQHPELNDRIGIVVVGQKAEEMSGMFPYPLHSLSYISDEHSMALLYSSVDAFVTPSLQDNLPNTIVEAMSCGTPCVGFRVGGIPEMIHHQIDGYLAETQNAQDLSDGIMYVLENRECLSKAAAQYAARTYNPGRVARLYEEVYQ